MSRKYTGILLVSLFFLLTSCENMILFNSQGQIGREEQWIIIITGALMLIVVIPVLILTPLFAWKYNASRWKKEYAQKHLKHRWVLDLLFWLGPALIVSTLAIISWNYTHRLDPFRPIENKGTPFTIQVIALDWKWLFIYPDQKVAVVNEVAFPVNVPVHFLITSDTVMNSFFIPQLGSQIYAMAGMQSDLHLIADKVGDYAGFSANISGIGFSSMTFTARALETEQFNSWVRTVEAAPGKLNREEYSQLQKQSSNYPVTYYSSADPNFFFDIIGKYTHAR